MIKITNVAITPNPANVSQTIKIEVSVEEASWDNIKQALLNWSQVKAKKNWQEIKDY